MAIVCGLRAIQTSDVCCYISILKDCDGISYCGMLKIKKETFFLGLWDDMQFCATSSELGLLTRVLITKCSKMEQTTKETLELFLPFWISLRKGFSFRNNMSASVLTMPNRSFSLNEFFLGFYKENTWVGKWKSAHFTVSFIECPPSFWMETMLSNYFWKLSVQICIQIFLSQWVQGYWDFIPMISRYRTKYVNEDVLWQQEN